MDTDVPRMPSVKNLHPILDSMQKAAVPDGFGIDFLKDMGYTSSNDRAIIKVLKYLGMLDSSGKPQSSYREFVDHTKSKVVLAACIRSAYDDLFKSDRNAHTKAASELKGWFKTKTGVGEKVAEKMATTFKSISAYADFENSPAQVEGSDSPQEEPSDDEPNVAPQADPRMSIPIAQSGQNGIGLTYKIEVHLPDTTNIDTYRSIFRAIREELM